MSAAPGSEPEGKSGRNLARMRTKLVVCALIVALGGGATYLIGARETWGPDVATDPNYKSGRQSVCEARMLPGKAIAANETIGPPHSAGRGAEQTISSSFDSAGLDQGVIDVCSEYGSIELVGSDDSSGRIDVLVRNPFPGGDRAVIDTKLAIDVSRDENRLHIGVRQLTQGVTSFRTWFARGSRPTHANVRITLPKRAEYCVRLVANHHYMSVRDLAIGGSFEGYGSPGVNINADLTDTLNVQVGGTAYQGEITDDPAIAAALARGGSTVRLRPRRSTTVNVAHELAGDVEVVLSDGTGGFDVTARGPRPTVALGPTARLTQTADATRARTAGFERAAVQVTVTASSATGAVTVKKMGD